jgi:2-amino-4-hydroxy-6-hydroxymethyldihydropteridine diphosphokinase
MADAMAVAAEIKDLKSGTGGFAIVALGSNLGDSSQLILDAMARLQTFSDAPILKSSLWETTPVNCPPFSRKFVNAIAGLEPRADETPESLLAKLQMLEKEFGREPNEVRNAPRRLDLDLIAFGNEIRSTPELVLPHPRAHQRRFVLQPLSEIAPDLILPGQTATVLDILCDLPEGEAVEWLSSPI